jgi:dTDP-4-dehydrorhamnose 3,5-epimerase
MTKSVNTLPKFQNNTHKMVINDTRFEGLKVITFFQASDRRGKFIKPWFYDCKKLIFENVSEVYFSDSKAGSIRGLHYQRGEYAQKKFVVCLTGRVEDIALDMRLDSATYGELFRITLDSKIPQAVLVPEGFAHGIFAHQKSLIANFCNKPYEVEMESGINWASISALKDLHVKYVSHKDEFLPPWIP